MDGRGEPVPVDRQRECGRHRSEEGLGVVERRIMDDRAKGFIGTLHKGH